MKRKASQKSATKRRAIECNICFEPQADVVCAQNQSLPSVKSVYQPSGSRGDVIRCRRCNKGFCIRCMFRWTVARDQLAEENGTRPTLPCPCCNLVPFFKPDFFYPNEGRPSGDKTIAMFNNRHPYLFRTVHDGVMKGTVVIRPDVEYFAGYFSHKLQDMDKLEKFAVDKDELISDLEEENRCVCSIVDGTEEDMKYIEEQFKSRNLNFRKDGLYFFTTELAEFLQGGHLF